MSGPIPVVDLFAGPGGLGEGFSAHRSADGSRAFRVRLSIEMDADAHGTLELRSFFHAFEHDVVPDEYYEHLQGKRTRASLFDAFPEAAAIARSRAWHAELGKTPADEVRRRIETVVGDEKVWVLCGGPPCQAYSIVGRSRSGGINLKDQRLYLYREYLKILAAHQPPVFIMENVKGLLSSTVKGRAIFTQMVEDLLAPGASVGKKGGCAYRICPLVGVPSTGEGENGREFSPNEYVIPCEKYGIPQSRHRVILLGVREDLVGRDLPTLTPASSGNTRVPRVARLAQVVQRAIALDRRAARMAREARSLPTAPGSSFG
jgi:DNA (cytosine-5)-methyltransferase 1